MDTPEASLVAEFMSAREAAGACGITLLTDGETFILPDVPKAMDRVTYSTMAEVEIFIHGYSLGYKSSLRKEEELEGKTEKALALIADYGGTDGDHHKQWLIDQLLRVLTDDYDQWVKDYQDGEEGVHTYTWDIGITP
jgi:hypothetical protein